MKGRCEMKKLVLIICLVLVMSLVVSTKSIAEDIFRGGYFAGGGNEESYTLEFGGITGRGLAQRRGEVLAIGATYFSDADDRLRIGERQNTHAFYGKYGIELAKDSGLFMNAIAGVGFTDKRQLGYYYETDKDDPSKKRPVQFEETDQQSCFLYGAGLSYFPPNSNLTLFIDYDNQRKVTGGIGWFWKY